MRWLFVLLLSVNLLAQNEFFDNYNKLQNGDTLIFNKDQIRKKFPFILALLLTIPVSGQVIMIGDKGYSPPADVMPPSVPSGLNGIAISDDSLLFYGYNSPEGDLNKYVMWFFGAVKDSTSNDSIYIGGLSPNTIYGLRVLAVDNSGNRSAYCDSIQRTTLDTTTAGGSVPATPTNLTVIDSVDGVDLSWTNNPPNADSIFIDRDGSRYDSVAYPAATWTDSDTVDGINYSYRVYASNAGGLSGYSNTVVAMRRSSNTIYVSQSTGSDGGDGSIEFPYQTIGKVNSLFLTAGQKIKFKDGDTWSGTSLIVQYSGTAGNNIVFAPYGSGANPILSLRTELSNIDGKLWSDSSAWTLAYPSRHVWSIALPTNTYYLSACWLSGQMYKKAYDIIGGTNYPFVAANLNKWDFATYPRIDSDYRWNQRYERDTFYVWTPCLTAADYNPASAYTNIEVDIKLGGSANSDIHLVDITNKSYITFDGLSFEGGYITMNWANVDYTEVKNSKFLSPLHALVIKGDYPEMSEHNNVHNNYITNGQDTMANGYYDYYSDPNGSSWRTNARGISVLDGSNYNRFYNDYLKGFSNCNFEIISNENIAGYTVIKNYFYNNIIDMDSSISSRGFQIEEDNQSTIEVDSNAIVNNTFINQDFDSHLSGKNSVCDYNIFDRVPYNNPPLYNSAGEVHTNLGTNYLYLNHNTWYDVDSLGIIMFDDLYNGTMNNNLIINVNSLESGVEAFHSSDPGYNTNMTMRNNVFFYEGLDSSDILVTYHGVSKTIAQLNAADTWNNTIDGNTHYVGLLADLINTTTLEIIPSRYLTGGANEGYALSAYEIAIFVDIYGQDVYSQDGTLIIDNGVQIDKRIGGGGKP